MKVLDVIKEIEADGWRATCLQEGSHSRFKHPVKRRFASKRLHLSEVGFVGWKV
jgi:hypothetical protein